MKKRLFIGALVVTIFLGLGLGFFLFVPNITASNIEWGDSPNTEPSPVYDERWRADEVCISTADGYDCIGNLINSPGNINRIAARILIPDDGEVDEAGDNYLPAPYVEYQPKAKVTKWKVEGHIHFP